MRFTERELTRATLQRQHLLARTAGPVDDAVRGLVALQAQHPASPYLALWNRVVDFDPADLDAAFAAGTLVRATLLRITLHVAHGADWPAWHQVMTPTLRAARLGDRRFTGSALTAADADALLPVLAEFARSPRTRPAVEAMLGERLDAARARGAWWALRTFAPLHHVPVDGPWAFSSPSTFRAAPPSPGTSPETPPGASREEATQRLVLRYLRAFGPATPRDVTRFTLLRRPEVVAAVAGLGEAVVPVDGPARGPYYDAAEAPPTDVDTPAPPRLLPMWDNALLAYDDRSRVIPDEYRPLVIRRNGDVLPTLLVDGRVVGVWRPRGDGIEVSAFEPLGGATWAELAVEAGSLAALLAARDTALYDYWGHWWDKGFPTADVRLLTP